MLAAALQLLPLTRCQDVGMCVNHCFRMHQRTWYIGDQLGCIIDEPTHISNFTLYPTC